MNLRPKQRVDEMLRAQIFNGLGARMIQSHGAGKKFVFRRNGDFEIAAVAGHIENGFADNRNLANHADVVWARGENERFYLVILADDTACRRNRRRA